MQTLFDEMLSYCRPPISSTLRLSQGPISAVLGKLVRSFVETNLRYMLNYNLWNCNSLYYSWKPACMCLLFEWYELAVRL